MTRRLRVLTVVDSMMSAGAEILATRIALGLDRDRFESVICSTRPSSAVHVAAARASGVEVLELDRRSRVDVWRWAPFVRLVRSGQVDVVHAHKFGSNLWTATLAPLGKAPVLVAHEHSWSFEGAPLRRVADRELIGRAATVFVAVSDRDRERMIAVERIPESKVRLVRNGIPDQRPGDGVRARRELGIPDGDPVVGTVCGLRPEKEVGVALEAVASVAGAHPGVRFLVVGDGPERARLERAAAALGVRALFVGRRRNDEVPDLVAAMDVAVCSSRFEGMPLSVLEWMAAGKAIVSTSVGGIPSVVDDGVEALLVPPYDPERLGAAVARLLADTGERRRLGDAARRRQQAHFRLPDMLATLQDMYEELHAAAAA